MKQLETLMYNHIVDIFKNSPVIYKYMSSETALSFFTEPKLLFSNPKTFNDPFDCHENLININKITPSILNTLKKKWKDEFPQAIKKIELAIESDDFEEIINAYRKFAIPEMLTKFGVTCFSKSWDKSLMWSHYAKSHSGICIGFNTVKLQQTIEGNNESNIGIFKVNYTDDFVTTDFFNEKTISTINLLTTKSSDWKYEEEIRIVAFYTDFETKMRRFFDFDTTSISEVIFGINSHKDTNRKLLDLIDNLKFPINQFKITTYPESFRLKRIDFNK